MTPIRSLGTAHATLAVATLLAFAPALAAQAARARAEDSAVVAIIAEDYAFDAPDVIRAGWTTLRFTNQGNEPHFVYMSRLPEGKSVEDYEADLSHTFARTWYELREGRADVQAALQMLGESLPDWYAGVTPVSGPGLLGPGMSAEATLRLEPGYYVLECYVKTEAGEIHYMEGMLRPITVSGAAPGRAAPAADARITLSNFEMVVEGELTAGRRTFEVHTTENPTQGFGHSVHLAKLEPEVDVSDVVAWLNWLSIDGYRAPAPVRWLGGLHPLPAGGTAYFTVDLEPGRYLLVSEETGGQGVRHAFRID